jgi:cell division protein FtsQ
MDAKQKHIIKQVAIIACMIGLLGYCIFAVNKLQRPEQKVMCSSMHIHIADSINNRFVSSVVIQNHLKENHIYPINKETGIDLSDSIEKSIASLNAVKEVECFMGYDGVFYIDVTQRVPLYRILNHLGETYYVDYDRHIMPISDLYTAYTPIATGYINKKDAQESFYDFMRYITEDRDWQALFAEVNVDKEQHIRLTSRQGIPYIEIGPLDNFQEKMEKLRAWYQQYPHKNDPTIYKKITITYEQLIFCTKIEDHE